MAEIMDEIERSHCIANELDVLLENINALVRTLPPLMQVMSARVNSAFEEFHPSRAA
jgi:hypothetical protein